MKRKRVAFLASGGGSNVEALLQAMADPGYPAEAVLVFCNRPGAGVLEKAARWNVPAAVVDHRAFPDRAAFDAEAVRVLRKAEPDLLCLAGYLRILTPGFVEAFRGRMLNIHPSLLPKFGGPGMHGHHVHEAVLAAGERESGATVHWVVEGVDAGEIVAQRRVPVLEGDDADRLAARVLTAEHQVYAEALRKVCGAGS
jgi:phosphoribosylglycinamide formyltransferase-1